MNVLHVIPSLSLSHGGPSQAIRAMEQSLLAQGISVETATTDDDGLGQRIAKPLGQRIAEEGAVRWYFKKNTEIYKCSWSFAHWLSSCARNYDLIHIHYLFTFASSYAALCARRNGIPYIIRPLGVLNRYGLTKRRPLLKKASLRFLEGPILQHAAAVHFTSAAEQREVESLGYSLKKGVVIPLATTAFESANPLPLSKLLPEVSGKRVILFLSRLDIKKNVEGLLNAFAQIAKQYSDSHLVIAGSGEHAYVVKLKGLAKNLGIQNRISWPGYVQGEIKKALLRDSILFVLPSYSENFGIAVAEALAAGLPCVVGRGVALAEQVELVGAGLSVNTDSADIANGIRNILDSETRRTNMSMRASALASAEFSDIVMGKRLRVLYEDICARSPVTLPGDA